MNNNLSIPAHIFRGNDIRGLVGSELTAEIYYVLGQGFGTLIRESQQKLAYVGHDSRATSKEFAAAFTQGLASTGCAVHTLGMVPTPVLYYAATQNNKAFGAMITASHLPAKYNGVKLCRGSSSLSRDDAQMFRNSVNSNKFASGDGSINAAEQIANEYIDYILSTMSERTSINVVLDCQNGAASIIAPKLVGKIAQLVSCIHCDPDSEYPFAKPDPQIPANLVPLREAVINAKADIGIAYDGDADRLAVVDNKGDYVLADYILAIMAKSMLGHKEHQGAKVVFDVLSSSTVYDEVTKNGGKPLWCKSGHSFIKEMMKKEHAKLGGESSGHMFFADNYLGYDDGVYASCRLIKLLSSADTSLSKQVNSLTLYVTSPEERPHCDDDKKHQIVEQLRKELDRGGYNHTTLDGIEIYFPNGRGVVRASNTEPALSVRFEATNQTDLEQYSQLIWPMLLQAAQSYNVTLER